MAAIDITARHPARRTTVLEIRYPTPEWSRAIAGLGSELMTASWLALSGAVAYAGYHRLIPLPAGKTIVAVAIGASIAFWLVWNANRVLQGWQRRRGVRAGLTITIGPNGLDLDGNDRSISIPRAEEFLFTAREHRQGKHEGREEQRVGHRLGYAYRDAWEVWLQAGHHVERLAGVADEASARAIVRYLQEADQLATRGIQQDDAMRSRAAPA